MNLSLILAAAGHSSAHFESATSFTFFVGCMAMMAASVFFFFEMWNVDKKWRTSLLVSGLITFIAFVMDSEYDILLRWEDLSFKGTMNLNVDGNRAFQTVQLQDPSGLWVKTKWALSLRDAADCKELCDTSDDGYWLIDNVMVSAR